MLDSTPELKQFIFVLDEQYKRDIVMDVITQFEDRVLSIKHYLEAGMIHGDFNEQNILVENVNGKWVVKSVLDFGDSQFNCYLYELAVTVAYMMILGQDLDIGGYVIAGYSCMRQIPAREFNLLKVSILD